MISKHEFNIHIDSINIIGNDLTRKIDDTADDLYDFLREWYE